MQLNIKAKTDNYLENTGTVDPYFKSARGRNRDVGLEAHDCDPSGEK
jgi:hypothetical protein